jgi:hypothetical protein
MTLSETPIDSTSPSPQAADDVRPEMLNYWKEFSAVLSNEGKLTYYIPSIAA